MFIVGERWSTGSEVQNPIGVGGPVRVQKLEKAVGLWFVFVSVRLWGVGERKKVITNSKPACSIFPFISHSYVPKKLEI